MNRIEPRTSAKILKFAPRPRDGAAGLDERQKQAAAALRSRVAAHDSWYHQAAIDEEKARPN